MRILLTNDDGIAAEGLLTLRQALRALGEVDVVAPAIERSAGSHAITLGEPLAAEPVRLAGSRRAYVVHGTPADCVKLALRRLLRRPPDLVVSGINHGANVGLSVFYSGTVAAAREAAMAGVNAVAVSALWTPDGSRPDFRSVAARFAELLPALLSRRNGTPRLLNVNFPDRALNGATAVAPARLSRGSFADRFDRLGPEGSRVLYRNRRESHPPAAEPDSDVALLLSGSITVTPLSLDLTHEAHLEDLRGKPRARAKGGRRG